MKQKEVSQSLDLQQSFSQNKLLSQSLRNATLLKKSGQVNQKFPSGKEYVKQARLELQNMSSKIVEQEVTLQSRPTVQRLERTKKMIEKQLVSRRERHLEVLNDYEKDTEDAFKEEILAYQKIQQKQTKFFNDSNKEIDKYFQELTDQYLLSQNFDILDSINQIIQNHEIQRNDQISLLNNNLQNAFIQYKNKYILLTDDLENDMMDISFILKTEIQLLKNENMDKINIQLKEIEQRNQEFLQKIDEEQQNKFAEYKESKIEFQKKYRKLKHDQSIQQFQIDIQKDEFIMPKEKFQYYQTLKQTHLDIFKNRKNLIEQLQNLPCQNLSQLLVEKFNSEAQKLTEISQNQYDILFEKLKKSNQSSISNSNKRLQLLVSTLQVYDAELEIPLNELIETQFQPQILQIQKNDSDLLQSVLIYLEETDYQSQEILHNISSYYLEIGKKLDQLKKTQTDLQLRYEVVKAKAADTNDEELDQLNENLEALKKSLREAVHHPMLDQQLVLIFEKVDDYEKKIREFHEINLDIAKKHPDLILEEIQKFEIECAPHFKMAGIDQKEILETQFKLELEEKIKNQIKEEEDEKERYANEQANKKGGKAPAKKDPKKIQYDFDIRFAELMKEQKSENIDEFQINGKTWIQFQKISEIVQQLQQVPDIKGVQAPQYNNEFILSEDCYITNEEISQIVQNFRNTLFEFITNKQQELLQLSKQEDHEFIQNSLILLDERLKKHYPLKGQIEVEIYQKRSSQITDHKQKYERHARQVIDKNQLQSQQFNFYVEEAMKLVRFVFQNLRYYMDDQNTLKEQLPLQPQLSKLQGILNSSKEKHYSFQEKSYDIFENLHNLSIEQPFNLEKLNKQFMKSIQESQEFSKDEVNWYDEMISEIWKEISQQQKEKEQKYQELKSYIDQNHKTAYEQLDQQYKLSQEELAQKDGTGKLYGRPKRLAQERLRLEMTKCEQAGLCINELLSQLEKKNDSNELRVLLITLRSCSARYAFHIEALNERAPEMIRLSRIDNKLGVLINSDEVENDKLYQEQELENLGSLAYQSDKTKKLSSFVQDIEKAVKEECQKIYQGQSAKWLTGQDKLPEWIRPYLDTMRKNMNDFRIQCCRNFREQCEKLSELAPIINQKIFESIYQKNTNIVIIQTQEIQNQFQQYIIQQNNQKQLHSRLLRPNLGNPACKQELDDLIQKEIERQEEFQKKIENQKESYNDQEFNISNSFFVCLLNNFEFLLTYYDNWILFEDFNLLPGDEQIVKKNQNLQTLYKLKQEGKQIDYNSERSITKVWNGLYLNTFKVDNREYQFLQQANIIDETKAKGVKAPVKGPQDTQQQIQQSNSDSKNIKSYKTQRQKTAYQCQINFFKQFQKRFETSIDKFKKLYDEALTEENKFQYKWQKSLEDLFK